MHGSSSSGSQQRNVVGDFKKRFQLLAKDSSTQLVAMVAGAWLILVIIIHLLGRAGAWCMVLLTQALILMIDIFILVTLQEYSDGVLREPIDVQRTVNPLSSLAIIFRALEIVQTLHAGSLVLPLLIYVPMVLYEFGLFRRFPASIDVTTLWKDAEPLKYEARFKIGINLALFFVDMFVMLAALLGSRVAGVN